MAIAAQHAASAVSGRTTSCTLAGKRMAGKQADGSLIAENWPISGGNSFKGAPFDAASRIVTH